jgi:hypothetical protein
MVEEKAEIRKRAGSSQERNKRFRERMVENKKKPPLGSLKVV